MPRAIGGPRERRAIATRRRSIVTLGLILLGGVAHAAGTKSAAPADAPPWTLEALLEPDPGPPPLMLGAAVAISQKRAAVGNRRNHDLGTDTGVIHFYDFVRKSWRLGHLVREPAGCLTCDFGAALDLDGERVIVGAPRDGALVFEAGRAHVFIRRGTKWALESTLSRPRPAAADLFGTAVAVSGRVAVVGVPYADHKASTPVATVSVEAPTPNANVLDAGAVEIFEQRDGQWIHAITLTPPSPTASGWFGAAVAVEGDLVAVGAYGHSDGIAAVGTVHLYRRTAEGWEFEQTLSCPWPGGAWFGYAVAIEGGRVLVGAPRAQAPGSGAATGGGFLFERRGEATFGLAATFSAPWLAAGDAFGISVALDRESALLGASGDDEAGEDAGAVYLFSRSGASYRPAEKLVIPGLSAANHAGASVAVTGGRLIIGRGGDPEADPRPGDGLAWVFTSPIVSPPPQTSSLEDSARRAPRRSQTRGRSPPSTE